MKISIFNSRLIFEIGFLAKISFHKKNLKKFKYVLTKINSLKVVLEYVFSGVVVVSLKLLVNHTNILF